MMIVLALQQVPRLARVRLGQRGQRFRRRWRDRPSFGGSAVHSRAFGSSFFAASSRVLANDSNFLRDTRDDTGRLHDEASLRIDQTGIE